jgi:molybdopterin molybdotransferase
VASRPGRRSYVRGQLLRDRTTGDYLAQPLGTAGSHLLSSLAEANALIVLDEDVVEASLDDSVRVAFLAPR